MFNNLVESSTVNSHQTNAKRFYFVATAFLNSAAFLAIFVWSIYSFNVAAIGQNEDLAVSMLVAPVALPETAPPPAPVVKQLVRTASSDERSSKIDRLRDPVENINRPTEPPRAVSTVNSDSDPIRENVPFVRSNITGYAPSDSGDAPSRTGSGATSPAIVAKQPTAEIAKTDEIEPPALPKTKIEKPPAKKTTTVSKGVVTGLATSLPKPVYSPAAKQIRAAGAVTVQVLIDENGSVVSATAVSGYPLLRAASVQAAKAAKFTPTKLSGDPVRVTGIIVYNFVAP